MADEFIFQSPQCSYLVEGAFCISNLRYIWGSSHCHKIARSSLVKVSGERQSAGENDRSMENQGDMLVLNFCLGKRMALWVRESSVDWKCRMKSGKYNIMEFTKGWL
jgi:hypothetical protein